MTTVFKTAVIKLGLMGYGMVMSCLRAGQAVWGANSTPMRFACFRQRAASPVPCQRA